MVSFKNQIINIRRKFLNSCKLGVSRKHPSTWHKFQIQLLLRTVFRTRSRSSTTENFVDREKDSRMKTEHLHLSGFVRCTVKSSGETFFLDHSITGFSSHHYNGRDLRFADVMVCNCNCVTETFSEIAKNSVSKISCRQVEL